MTASSRRFREPPADMTPDEVEGQHAALDDAAVAIIRESPMAAELMDRLLDRAGRHVALQLDRDIEQLLSRGRFRDGRGAVLIEGEPCSCHSNAARLWMAAPAGTSVETGYALSDDGIWRQHTWAHRRGKVLETTVPRELYFGYALDRAEALAFAAQNR